MSIQTDTSISNILVSDELKQLLLDLASHVHDTYEIVKKIRTKAHEEGFNDDEIYELLKDHLGRHLDRKQVNYIEIKLAWSSLTVLSKYFLKSYHMFLHIES